ncbi:DUF1622 domain-containing protein [Sphingobium subterraneum]|uniref:Putative membrane protein n=1 Tax=Sphingobium subterraneum TaxID=627688 RepID=A0A841JBJ7_9SPHN|nr:DUF1622 domain-containing protein [Sphingobium subterraneum]MBB6125491.1 putative membrane protein [Sphingobium subterraneum]
MDSVLIDVIHWITRAIELTGTGIIVSGAGAALLKFLGQVFKGALDERAVGGFRSNLGEAILLGLEFLVAADIINTIAIQPTLQSLAVLAGIVLIRTFLSFSLEVEIKGRWPWQRETGKHRDT